MATLKRVPSALTGILFITIHDTYEQPIDAKASFEYNE